MGQMSSDRAKQYRKMKETTQGKAQLQEWFEEEKAKRAQTQGAETEQDREERLAMSSAERVRCDVQMFRYFVCEKKKFEKYPGKLGTT